MAKAFIHEKALCETPHIGEGTCLWPFSHVLAGARVGRDCNICENVFIEADVVVGNDVTIKNGVQLWDGVRASYCQHSLRKSCDQTLMSRQTT